MQMLRDLPVQSPERPKASNALLQLRKDEVNLGKVGELPSELKGECVKISHAWSGNRCDIWKGLRLDQEVVALKFYRVYQRPDDQGKNKEVRVSAPTPTLHVDKLRPSGNSILNVKLISGEPWIIPTSSPYTGGVILTTTCRVPGLRCRCTRMLIESVTLAALSLRG